MSTERCFREISSHIETASIAPAQDVVSAFPDEVRPPVWRARYRLPPYSYVWDAYGTHPDDVDRRRDLFRVGDHAQALQGWPAHPAYVFGNHRLSCALCILASNNDIRVGATHNPALYQELVSMEQDSGFSFRPNLALQDLFTNTSTHTHAITKPSPTAQLSLTVPPAE